MSWGQIWKKYSLVILLVWLAVFMAAVKISYKNKDWSDEIAKSVTPTMTPSPTLIPTRAPKQNIDYPLWQELPYDGEGFTIDRYLDKKTVVVQRKGLDKKIVEEEVMRWFEENNIATEEIKIKWE